MYGRWEAAARVGALARVPNRASANGAKLGGDGSGVDQVKSGDQ